MAGHLAAAWSHDRPAQSELPRPDLDAPAWHPRPSPSRPRSAVRAGPANTLGWRGSRVYLQWSTGVGELHLGWLPATQGRRT